MSAGDFDDERGENVGFSRVQGEGSLEGGYLVYDANANCAGQGTPRENIVFQHNPKPGLYFVYVNLAEPCGEAAQRPATSEWLTGSPVVY